MPEAWIKRLACALLIAGAGLRLGIYLADRSLWFDEAALAEQLLSRPFAALSEARPGDQCAPLGFLYAEKALASVFGSSEFVLRALPCLGALAALFLYWCLARVWLTPAAQLIALWLTSVCWPLIYFGAQVKQYSTDVALALALLWAGWRWQQSRGGAKAALWLALAGGAAVWFSFTAVFVLAAFAMWLLFIALRDGQRRRAGWLAAASCLWLCSFALHYLLFMRTVYIENPTLVPIWAFAFAPLPANWDNLSWYGHNFWYIFELPGGLFLPQFAATVFVLGCLSLFRSNRRLLALLMLPPGLGLLASAMHKYPFGGRLLLFAAPLFLAVLAEGLAGMLRLKWRSAQVCGVILLMVFGLGSTVLAFEHVLAPRQLEEMRPVMVWVAELHRPGDKVLNNYAAAAAIKYYSQRLNISDLDMAWGANRRTGPQGEPQGLSPLMARERVWLLLSHYRDEEATTLLNFLSARGAQVQEVDFPGAKAFLFLIKAAP